MATDVDRLCQAISDVDYPADKSDLVQTALVAGADAETVSALNAIPQVTYNSETDVLRAAPLESKQAEADRAAQRKLRAAPVTRIAPRLARERTASTTSPNHHVPRRARAAARSRGTSRGDRSP